RRGPSPSHWEGQGCASKYDVRLGTHLARPVESHAQVLHELADENLSKAIPERAHEAPSNPNHDWRSDPNDPRYQLKQMWDRSCGGPIRSCTVRSWRRRIRLCGRFPPTIGGACGMYRPSIGPVSAIERAIVCMRMPGLADLRQPISRGFLHTATSGGAPGFFY